MVGAQDRALSKYSACKAVRCAIYWVAVSIGYLAACPTLSLSPAIAQNVANNIAEKIGQKCTATAQCSGAISTGRKRLLFQKLFKFFGFPKI